MTQFVALLRGIGPANPNMRNENLRRVCQALGFRNVATVISSGNLVFEADSEDRSAMEAMLEEAWPSQLGFQSTTIVRSRDDLERLVEAEPFGGLEHGPSTYLLVTFAKAPLTVPFELPFQPEDRSYLVVGATEGELFTVTDTTAERTPDVMSWIERQFGKGVSSRTWLTVDRILKRMRRPD